MVHYSIKLGGVNANIAPYNLTFPFLLYRFLHYDPLFLLLPCSFLEENCHSDLSIVLKYISYNPICEKLSLHIQRPEFSGKVM